MLQLTEQLLAEAGIDHWMEGGAVLGLLREGKLHRYAHELHMDAHELQMGH